MKYQSELIKEMIDGRGHKKSSLHYESECIESWIEESKGAYPKLCDYESEWLNYIVHNPIGEFPYETVSTNTTATVNHVVPYAYKSAILSGNTLVNLIKSVDKSAGVYTKENEYHIIEHKSDINYISFKLNCRYKLDTTKNYMMFMNVKENTLTSVVRTTSPSLLQDKTLFSEGFVGLYKLKFTPSNSDNDFIWVRTNSGSSGKIVFSCMVIEYQDGMENWDIPYFEGMQSVKMPVLKTSNSNNLIDTNPKSWHIIDGKTQIIQNKPIEVQPNTTYSFFINSGRWGYIFKCDEFGNISKQYIGNNKGGGTFVTDDDCYYIIARNDLYADVTRAHTDKMRLFAGTKDLGYTGYVDEVKSNILTVNEPIELRGIGDVQDELDCLTGELTQRVGEVVLDGGEDWNTFKIPTSSPNHAFAQLSMPQLKTGGVLSENFPCHTRDLWGTELEGFYVNADNMLQFNVQKSKLSEVSLNGLKNYIRDNSFVLSCVLNENVVKTVDLSVTDQDGNTLSTIKPIEGMMYIEVSGSPVAPTAVLEVPVEAITQNLASFIGEE